MHTKVIKIAEFYIWSLKKKMLHTSVGTSKKGTHGTVVYLVEPMTRRFFEFHRISFLNKKKKSHIAPPVTWGVLLVLKSKENMANKIAPRKAKVPQINGLKLRQQHSFNSSADTLQLFFVKRYCHNRNKRAWNVNI